MKKLDALGPAKWRRIRALMLDVDGVLTDGGMYYSETSQELKRFHARDGMGIALLIEKGLPVAFVTGESSKIALRRAEKLGVKDVFLGVDDKVQALRTFCERHRLQPSQVAYVGDDLNDLGIMSKVGLAIAVGDAHYQVVQAAHAVTFLPGGAGAVREVADTLLKFR